MSIVTVKHRVKDFGEWKKAFDANEPARKAAGLKVINLQRRVDSENELLITMEAADVAKARAFAESEELKNVMAKAGVLGPPDVFIGSTV